MLTKNVMLNLSCFEQFNCNLVTIIISQVLSTSLYFFRKALRLKLKLRNQQALETKKNLETLDSLPDQAVERAGQVSALGPLPELCPRNLRTDNVCRKSPTSKSDFLSSSFHVVESCPENAIQKQFWERFFFSNITVKLETFTTCKWHQRDITLYFTLNDSDTWIQRILKESSTVCLGFRLNEVR